MSDIHELLPEIAPCSMPMPLPRDPQGRAQRVWMVRGVSAASESEFGAGFESTLTEAASRELAKVCAAAGLPPCGPPVVKLRYVDEFHVAVAIETDPDASDPTTHAWLICASVALRAFDAVHRIDDLQGIPRRYWLLLRDVDSTESSADAES